MERDKKGKDALGDFPFFGWKTYSSDSLSGSTKRRLLSFILFFGLMTP
jgi:hypothetical protein